MAGTQSFRRYPHEDLPPARLPPPPPRHTRVSRSDNGIHEINATTAPPAGTSSLDQLLPPFLPEATPPCTLTSAISPGVDASHTPPPPIAEHEPGLLNGSYTVNDTSFTTRTKVHTGPSASSRYGLVALLHPGSPQTSISAETWTSMKHSNAASDICSPRSWGGFGKPAPLLTSTSVRLSIQFLHGNTPSAELAVWACNIPVGTMQCPFLLERDNWVRFAQRTHTTLPASPPNRPLANFLSPFPAPKAPQPSPTTSDQLPTPSTSSSPACTQFRFRLRRLLSR